MTALLNNRYRILKTLGRGGFGETYLAEDSHMPSGRQCVLKELKPIVKQPKIPLWMKERFQREAAILEELGASSSQIPQLYAYFSERGKFYLVQEWIVGLTLDQYWEQEGNLHRDEVRQILLQLLPVLEYVHSRRIIHRDIKPENIILRQDDRFPVLIDFGAVKEAMNTEVNQNSHSTYSASIGTPGYMSSEQAAGRPIYSSDLYSLGLTAIFLLTGKSPHELESNPRNGEIIWQEHAFNLDSDLAEILSRAIRFHPRDRFATATEMLTALQQGLEPSMGAKTTGVTLNVAPARNYASDFAHEQTDQALQRSPTQAFTPPASKGRGVLASAGLFLLIALGVGLGTLAAGFIVISSIWRSPGEPPSIDIEAPIGRLPDLFPPEVTKNDPKSSEPQDQSATANQESPTKPSRAEELAQNRPELDSSRKPTKAPKTLAKVEVTPDDADYQIDFPLLTTGSSESQLVSTLGQPNSQRQGWQPNSRVLVYYDVVPNQINQSYQSDDSGKIRHTEVAINANVSLGAMQQTLGRMLGGDAPADVKQKLRNVYHRQNNFSFFKLKNLEGKVQRDSKDRINISVWERGYQ